MSANHMNLKRISHRIKEELGSTIEVAKVVAIYTWLRKTKKRSHKMLHIKHIYVF